MGMRMMKMLLLILGLGLFAPTFASADFVPASPYPWPWPWARPCKMNWTNVAGDWELESSADNTALSISVQMVSNNILSVHVRRIDDHGIHSDGTALVKLNKNFAVINMKPRRMGVDAYVITIRNVYTSKQTVCDHAHVATILTIQQPPDGNIAGNCDQQSWELN
jgi:hypothetical protein